MKRARTKEEVFRRFVQELIRKKPRSTILLFGSRAKGGATPLSDYDLLMVVERPADIEAPSFVQLFVIDVRDVEAEIRRFNTLVIDAVVEGIVVDDGRGIYEEVRRLVRREIARRRVKRDERGWVPSN